MENMENNGFWGGDGFIVLILFLLLMSGGSGFGFGGNAAQGALTRAEMNDGFNMAEVQRNQSDIKTAICGLDKSIMENRYAAALQAQTAQMQMSTGFCDLKTAIHAEGEAVRAMLQQNQIDDLKQQLNTAVAASANAVQTQNILNALGRYVTNPPVSTCGGCYTTGCGVA